MFILQSKNLHTFLSLSNTKKRIRRTPATVAAR